MGSLAIYARILLYMDYSSEQRTDPCKDNLFSLVDIQLSAYEHVVEYGVMRLNQS